MKSEQTVYTCNNCNKERVYTKGSFGGSAPFNIEVTYQKNPVGFGCGVASLDFCSFKCLKEFAEKQIEKED